MMLKLIHQLLTSRSILIVVVLLIAISGCAIAQSQASVTVRPVNPNQPVMLVVDGKVLEIDSVTMSPRGEQVMVWMRDLEKIGWGTIESGQPGEVIFRGKTVTLKFKKDQDIALVNSLVVKLPVDAYMIGARLMVPLSFVTKALGYDYDLSYKPVASINTSTIKAISQARNTIQGKVIYNGKGIRDIKVRAVDKAYNVVKNVWALTDMDGDYNLEGLPDGEFRAYVYVKDNPLYFNRASDAAMIKDGRTVEMKPISLGKVIIPASPGIGEIATISSGRIHFAWASCEGAASYELVVKKHGTDTVVAKTIVTKNEANLPISKLSAATTYDAQVSASNDDGEYLGGTVGAGGTPWIFSTPKVIKAHSR